MARAVVRIDDLTCLVRFRVDGLSIKQSVADLQDSVQDWSGSGNIMKTVSLGEGYGSEGGSGEYGGRYWYRTSGLFRVKEALYP